MDNETHKMVAQRNPQIKRAAVKLRELSADEKARDMFERREKGRRDYHAKMDGAVKDTKFEIARNMIADGEPIERIMKYTGLTREEIEGIKQSA